MNVTHRLFILMGFLLGLKASGQDISSFRLQQFDNSVIISFTMKQGSTCNGIDILRSTDSSSYTLAGNIDGVCGSSNADIPYTFIDNTPSVNVDNYYRLDLRQLGFSAVLKIHVFDNSTKMLVMNPNPATLSVYIYYSSQFGHKATLHIYDSSGKLVNHDLEINEVPFYLDTKNLVPGIYLLNVVVENKSALRQKLVISE